MSIGTKIENKNSKNLTPNAIKYSLGSKKISKLPQKQIAIKKYKIFISTVILDFENFR
jgi:hypothetical protein